MDDEFVRSSNSQTIVRKTIPSHAICTSVQGKRKICEREIKMLSKEHKKDRMRRQGTKRIILGELVDKLVV